MLFMSPHENIEQHGCNTKTHQSLKRTFWSMQVGGQPRLHCIYSLYTTGTVRWCKDEQKMSRTRWGRQDITSHNPSIITTSDCLFNKTTARKITESITATPNKTQPLSWVLILPDCHILVFVKHHLRLIPSRYPLVLPADVLSLPWCAKKSFCVHGRERL